MYLAVEERSPNQSSVVAYFHGYVDMREGPCWCISQIEEADRYLVADLTCLLGSYFC